MKKRLLMLMLVTLVGATCITACGNNADREINTENNQEDLLSEEKGDKDIVKKDDTDLADGSLINNDIASESLDILGLQKNQTKYMATFGDVELDIYYENYNLQIKEYGDDEYRALSEALNKHYQESYSTEYVNWYVDLAREYASNEDGWVNSITANQKSYIMRSDARVLSIREEYYDYTGGAHGNYGTAGVNFDAQTGKTISIEDLVVDTDTFSQLAVASVPDSHDSSIKSNVSSELEFIFSGAASYGLNYTFDYDGVTIYFNPYEVGSYADGEICAYVSYLEHPEVFNDYYFENAPEKYFQSLCVNGNPSRDYDKDGKAETLRVIYKNWDDSGNMLDHAMLTVEYDSKVYEICDTEEDGMNTYLYHDGDDVYFVAIPLNYGVTYAMKLCDNPEVTMVDDGHVINRFWFDSYPDPDDEELYVVVMGIEEVTNPAKMYLAEEFTSYTEADSWNCPTYTFDINGFIAN